VNGLVSQFRRWMTRAILPQVFIAVSVDGGSAPCMLRMIAGTPAFSSRAKRVAKVKAIVDRQYFISSLSSMCVPPISDSL
jgi:hypothetical protein